MNRDTAKKLLNQAGFNPVQYEGSGYKPFETLFELLDQYYESKQKPDWSDAPEWAKYMAQTGSGRWCYYSKEPYLENDKWQINHCLVKWSEFTAPKKDWRETLEKRPE